MKGRNELKVWVGGCLLGLALTGCGGGSSSSVSDSVIAQEDMVTIDDSNKETVISSLVTSQYNSDALTGTSVAKSAKSTADEKMVTYVGLNSKSISVPYGIEKLNNEVGTYECSVSGTIDYVLYDDGDYAITFNRCDDGAGVMSGKENVSHTDNELHINVSEFTYQSEYQSYTIDSLDETITYDDEGYIRTIEYALNGSYEDESTKIDFADYRVTENISDEDYVHETVHGYVRTSCLNAWIKVDEDITFNYWDEDIVSGEVTFSGNDSELRIIFSEEGDVDVYLNDVHTDHYDSESEFESNYEAEGVCQS